MKDVNELFEDIVLGIDRTITIKAQDNDVYYTCDTKWLRVGKIITGFNFDDVQESAIVLELLDDQSFKLSTNTIVKGIECPLPFAITGTRIATNLEWTRSTNLLLNKTPLIWLLDNYRETEYGKEASLERDIDLTVFFLDETDIVNFYTKDHKQQVIKPMRALKDAFLNVIKSKAIYKRNFDVRLKSFTKFGTENENGFQKNIIDANLSGLSLEFTLQKYKENCKC